MKVGKVFAGMMMGGLLVPGLALSQADYGGRDEAGYATTTLDSRVSRLEKRLQGQPLTEMSRDIDRLQSEIRQLRGTVEELRDGLDKARRQEKEHFAALEKRNADLEARLLALAPPPPPPPVVTAPLMPGTVPPGADPNAPPPLPGTVPAGAVPPPLTAGAPPPDVGVVPDGTVTAAPPAVEPAAVTAPAVPPPPIVPPDPVARQRDYERAFDTLKAGKYTDAIAEFQTFVAKYPEGEFSDNANYWLGEAHYVNRDFAAAREAFRRMIKDFPQSGKVPDAQLKLAFIEYENEQYGKAKGLLNEVIKRYPETSAAKMAEKRLARMKQENH